MGHLDRLNQAVVHKLDGLSEYDVRRPMTATATNLLGVAFHLASLQA
ncbi:MAG: mycothiol transferase, partial [Oryzihumus sp.]